MEDDRDPRTVILWHFEADRDIAYIFGTQPPFHVQVSYLHESLHMGWPGLKDIRSNTSFIKWVTSHYMYFSKDHRTPESDWLENFQRITDATEKQWREQHEGPQVQRCGSTDTHQSHRWGKGGNEYKCPGIRGAEWK